MANLTNARIALALAGLCGVIFFSRLHTYGEPLERDLTTYAVIGHEMLGGRALYTDLWDHKPPAIHLTYAAAELIAGYGRDAIFLLNLAAGVATLLACYAAGSAAGAGPMGGVISAALWALASGDLALEANQPNVEVFLNCLMAAGFAVFVRKEKSGLGIRGAAFAGALFALASLYKQVVVVEAGLITIAYLALAPAQQRKVRLGEVAIIAAIGLFTWAIVFEFFLLQGHAATFFEAVFTYNRFYAGSAWANLTRISAFHPISADTLAVLFPLAMMTVTGLVIGLVTGPRRPWILLLFFAIGAHIAILLPGHFFPHYYQLWLPPLVIGGGWSIVVIRRCLSPKLGSLCYAAPAIAGMVLIALELPSYRLPASEWSRKKYGDIFIETDQLALRLDQLLSPGEKFFEWGSESGLYHTSGRDPISGVVFADPLLAGPVAAKLTRRLLDDLDHAKPDLIVLNDETIAQTSPHHPMLTWLRANYLPIARTHSFILAARAGSRLAGEKLKLAEIAPR